MGEWKRNLRREVQERMDYIADVSDEDVEEAIDESFA